MRVKVDLKDFEREARALFPALAKALNKPIDEIIIDQSKLFAVEAANIAPRKGLSPSGGTKHKENVGGNIDGHFVSAKAAAMMISKQYGYKTGKRFEKMMKGGRIAQADTLCRTLNARTSGDGRIIEPIEVGRMEAVHAMIRKRKVHRLYVVRTQKDINALKRKNKETVGSIKKPWHDIFTQLGGVRGIPAYVKKAKGAEGHAVVKRTGFTSEPHVAMRSNSKRAGQVNYRRAWQARIRKMEKLMKRISERELSKVFNKANR